MSTTKLGATGDFPRGKLDPTDEGGLRMAFTVKDGTVVVKFFKPVAWIGLTPADARQFAVFLMKRANEADKSEPFIRAGGDVVCDVCGDVYRHHPHDMKELDNMGEPFLKVRCDGRRLKL
jgi:hypothetical protein